MFIFYFSIKQIQCLKNNYKIKTTKKMKIYLQDEYGFSIHIYIDQSRNLRRVSYCKMMTC